VIDGPLRRAGIGANLLAGENLAAELKRRNYPEAAIGKILGGNLLRTLRQVLR
jgi:microsomal dipeptidase-like Zn-dependent dipeptidase